MKNLTNYLDTSKYLYLIEFQGNKNGVIFNSADVGLLGDLIQLHGKHGILQVRRYSALKMKFERISKDLVKQLFSWDTHSTEQLKRVNYIK